LPINRSKPVNGKPKVEKIRYGDLRKHEHSYLYYATGGPREPEQIICGDSSITVGGELYAALKRLRKPEEDRVMWIGTCK